MERPQLKLFPTTETIQALSWKEPYGSLMLHGKIETRTWPTKYRGLVLICASKAPYPSNTVKSISGIHQFGRIIETLHGDTMNTKYPRSGVAFAIGYLMDCRPMQKSDENHCYVEYYPDLFCHIYRDVKPIEEFAWKGSQGWRKLTEEEIKKIKILTPYTV